MHDQDLYGLPAFIFRATQTANVQASGSSNKTVLVANYSRYIITGVVSGISHQYV